MGFHRFSAPISQHSATFLGRMGLWRTSCCVPISLLIAEFMMGLWDPDTSLVDQPGHLTKEYAREQLLKLTDSNCAEVVNQVVAPVYDGAIYHGVHQTSNQIKYNEVAEKIKSKHPLLMLAQLGKITQSGLHKDSLGELFFKEKNVPWDIIEVHDRDVKVRTETRSRQGSSASLIPSPVEELPVDGFEDMLLVDPTIQVQLSYSQKPFKFHPLRNALFPLDAADGDLSYSLSDYPGGYAILLSSVYRKHTIAIYRMANREGRDIWMLFDSLPSSGSGGNATITVFISDGLLYCAHQAIHYYLQDTLFADPRDEIVQCNILVRKSQAAQSRDLWRRSRGRMRLTVPHRV